MSFRKTVTPRAVVVAHVAAVLIGASAALAATHMNGQVKSAYAASHCTRYGPLTSPDTSCTINGTLGTQFYITQANALRDSNYITTVANRWIDVWYDEGPISTAYGTWLQQGASSGYAVAQCDVDGSSVGGHCTTYWHN
jgi:hypothetical protein